MTTFALDLAATVTSCRSRAMAARLDPISSHADSGINELPSSANVRSLDLVHDGLTLFL